MPVYDKAGLTGRCLDALLADPPKVGFEIVIVDDGSTDSTQSLLAGRSEPLEVLTHDRNLGFATSCNDGAAAAEGEYLVFLNNDTTPVSGWLDALADYADRHTQAGVVGSKLLFHNDTIQHAGVVFCSQGKPRHIYAGFPMDHPAVNKSRRFQAVTFACALVRRQAFDEAGGFDTAFENDLEDIDLCLRLGELGHEVHYCCDSVLRHLESASRGRQFPKGSAHLFRDRWSNRVTQDDLTYYQEDGLFQLEYKEPYPLRLNVSPALATTGEPQNAEAERLVHTLSRQVLSLLHETARLTALLSDFRSPGTPEAGETRAGKEPAEPLTSYGDLQRRTREIELEIQDLQAALAAAAEDEQLGPGDYLNYRRLLVRIRDRVSSELPAGSVVLVVSRGDDELLGLDGQKGVHFPSDKDGGHQAHNPPDSGWAIDHLEELRTRGAEYLLIPNTELWWLDHYEDFRKHLEHNYPLVLQDEETCLIFGLASRSAGSA
jgi:GT2 family glycosyltransferase